MARDSVAHLPATVDTMSVRGYSHLSAAIVAARAGGADTSADHLRAAGLSEFARWAGIAV